MRWSMRIVMMLAVSIVIVVCLSLLPKLDSSMGLSSPYHWPSNRIGQVTDNNLPDLLVQVPLQMRIRKVELTNARMSLDLSLPKNADSAAVYRDLYTIAQTMLMKTKNVNQVWVRVIDYSNASDSASTQLVLAMVAERESGKDMEKGANELSLIQLEQELQNRFRITYTSKWQQRYPL
ncbi:hypothetical protein HZF08_28795 [Paenibacillus sp. CGMCC 1.16610]|uniref:DUF4825 domain-containing protein n=1 Tax=Paenibacillus anseongense TaxID=2682845 RepID=A0ABW9U9L7_9BACL|nr:MULTISPECIES: hypothetical protein [Paenibacillus]MBA2942274.1 hypothetical protein [Paenibacillus sp. CGMCC 1.16610]MVQ36106.1 hypothetical protein [Paenibacillus anseongense]